MMLDYWFAHLHVQDVITLVVLVLALAVVFAALAFGFRDTFRRS